MPRTIVDPPGRPRRSKALSVTHHPAGARFEVPEDLDIYPRREFSQSERVFEINAQGARDPKYPGLSAYAAEQRDQSCVGAVAAKLIEAQVLRDTEGVQAGELNPEFLWLVAQQRDNTPEDPRSGLHEALSVAVDYGVPPLDPADGVISQTVRHPGTAVELRGTDASDRTFVKKHLLPLLQKANKRRIESFATFGAYLEAWKAHLIDRGPLAVQLNVTPAFDLVAAGKSKQVDGGLPLVDMQDDEGELYGNGPFDSHAVLFLDYIERGDDQRSYFVLINSYGRGWGKQGFAALTVAQAKRSVLRAFGVKLLPSIETVSARGA